MTARSVARLNNGTSRGPVHVFMNRMSGYVSEVDIAMRIRPQSVSGRCIPACNLVALLVHDNDRRFEVAYVNRLARIDINIRGPVEVAPLRYILSLERK